MITSISFASWQGSDLDNNAKQFRILADILNDAAIFLELISPLFPSVFVAIVCFASFARAMVGVAGGATRAAMRQHQARANNTGDVSAKDGSQETLVNLVALLVNLVLVRLVANSQVCSQEKKTRDENLKLSDHTPPLFFPSLVDLGVGPVCNIYGTAHLRQLQGCALAGAGPLERSARCGRHARLCPDQPSPRHF